MDRTAGANDSGGSSAGVSVADRVGSAGRVWLLHPASRTERITRRLRFAAVDIRNGEQAKTMVGTVGPRSEEERLNQVRELAERAGIDPAGAVRKAGYREIVDKACGWHLYDQRCRGPYQAVADLMRHPSNQPRRTPNHCAPRLTNRQPEFPLGRAGTPRTGGDFLVSHRVLASRRSANVNRSKTSRTK